MRKGELWEEFMMHMAFHFNNPTNLIFGRGTRMELGRQKMPGRKALLLLSNGNSTKVNGSFDCVTQQLTEAGVAYTVFRKALPLQGNRAVILSLRLAVVRSWMRPKRLPQWRQIPVICGTM